MAISAYYLWCQFVQMGYLLAYVWGGVATLLKTPVPLMDDDLLTSALFQTALVKYSRHEKYIGISKIEPTKSICFWICF